tara:strand:- start:53 stop:763 length:711 start_codon:yes stop_codon:yes gene_type:complete
MNNFVEIYENALSAGTTDYIVNLFNTQKDLTYQGVAGKTKILDVSKKDSTDLDLMHYGKDKIPINIIKELEESLTNYLTEYCLKYPLFPNKVDWTTKKNKEAIKDYLWRYFSVYPFSVLCKKYKKGEQGYHSWHQDRGSQSPSIHRHLVCMYYLNDVEKGGETEFYNQKLKVKPKKGSLVIFPATFTHIHKGNIPISNDKYIMNFWILKGKPIKGDLERMRNKYFLIEPEDNKILN